MKKLFFLIPIFFILASFSKSETAFSDNTAVSFPALEKPSAAKLSLEHLSEMKVKEFEKLTGKKLRLKERLSFKLLQLKIKKELKKEGSEKSHSKGNTAFILSLIGLGLILVPYGIIASVPLAILAIIFGSQAKKDNPKDKKAQTAIILGVVTLGLFAVLLIIALIWLAAFAGWLNLLGG